MLEMDEAESALKAINKEIQERISNIKTEEDAKVHIINRIVNECLGWPYSAFRSETKHDNGYSDHILVDEREKPALLIEAKRIGVIDVKTADKAKLKHLRLDGSAMREAIAGVEQAASYSLTKGIPISVLTDGLLWIVFKTFVTQEDYRTKKAIIFPSLDAVIQNFSVFFELLSKDCFNKRLYGSIFDSIHESRLLLTQPLVAPVPTSEIHLERKSEIAFDLEKVFTKFFSKLLGDDDEDLLIECFVETHESRIADFSLEKITLSVLGNIVPRDKDVDLELASIIQSNIDTEDESTESGQTVFIVGPTGAGKTTFLDRFFRKTLPESTRKKCVLLKINCLDATGRGDTVLEWLTENLISSIESTIYENGYPTWDELLGLYHKEYVRRANGVDKQLYKRDKSLFKEKFSEFLNGLVEKDREGYLKRILDDVVKNRKMLPVILIDNTDEFSNEFKERVFQFSQSLRRNSNHCLLIFPVTDKSAWSFSKTDIYGIYNSRSFFLPTPSPREIFRKRIDFLKNKLHQDSQSIATKGSYFIGNGIKLSLDNLEGFAQVLENVFVEHDYTARTIGELTNYNIRRTLALSQRIMTSPVIKIEDLIRSYIKGEFVTTKFSRFMDALMKGDYELYRQGDNHEVFPVFQVNSELKHSPLLFLRILVLLNAIHGHGRTIEERHMNAQSIINYFDSMNCSESAVNSCLLSLLEAGLIEPFDISRRDLANDQKLAISYRGKVHLSLASHNSVFLYQMALTTAISDSDVAYKIRSAYEEDISFKDKVNKVRVLFIDYLLKEDSNHLIQGFQGEQYQGQVELEATLKGFVSKSNNHEDPHDLFDSEYTKVTSDVVRGTVDFYDSSKGFGFVDIDEVEAKIFIHSEKLKEYGIGAITDGDEILCNLARGSKGLYIDKIQYVKAKTDAEVIVCQIIRIFHERGYGFIKEQNSDRSAFFHVSIFPVEVREHLKLGDMFQGIMAADKTGKGYQIKQYLSDSYET
ncbi:MAG: cold shock domain-containing protein [Methylophaga sp.]